MHGDAGGVEEVYPLAPATLFSVNELPEVVEVVLLLRLFDNLPQAVSGLLGVFELEVQILDLLSVPLAYG